MTLVRRVIIFFIVLIPLAGCDYIPFGYTAIGEITRSPGHFEGEEIRVKGTVTYISKLPFFETKSYTLRDETGEITVFTETSLPAMEETVAIKVRVETAAIIGDQSFGLRLEEIKKLPVLSLGK